MYAIDDKLDILTSFAGSYIKNEYINYFTFDPKANLGRNLILLGLDLVIEQTK